MLKTACTYCIRWCPDAEIVETFAMGDRVNALCSSCVPLVREVEAEWLYSRVIEQDLRHPMEREQAVGYLVGRARRFLLSPCEPKHVLLPEGEAARAFAHEQRWHHLVRSRALDWLPVSAAPRVRPTWGNRLEVGVADFDGRRRLAAALAWGYDRIRILLRPPKVVMPKPNYQYQTLAGPEEIVPGERSADRWPLLPMNLLQGARIVELGCASGMDGILACVCGAESYTGWEVYPEAVEAGRRLAEMWSVAHRVTLHVADVKATPPPEVPKADAVFVFSSAIQCGVETHVRALEQSGAALVLLETHLLDDPESEAFMRAVPFEWEPLGLTRYLNDRDETVQGRPVGRRVRRLLLGSRSKGESA